MKTFKIIRNPYDDKINIFKKKEITLESGVTVLVGCNGFGKTSFLKCIKKCLNDEDLKYVYYDNLHDGGSNSISKALFTKDDIYKEACKFTHATAYSVQFKPDFQYVSRFIYGTVEILKKEFEILFEELPMIKKDKAILRIFVILISDNFLYRMDTQTE